MLSDPNSSRRGVLRAAGVAAITGLAGCSVLNSNTNDTSSSTEGKTNKLVLYNMGGLKYDQGTAKNIERFEKQTGITVSVNEVPWVNLKTTLTTQFRNESSKVDAFIGPTWWLSDFIAADWIEPLGLSDDHMSKFPKNIRKLVTFDGKVFHAPTYGKWGTFLYNKPYLSKHGFESPPGTWDEVISMGNELKSGSMTPFACCWDTRDIFLFKQLLYQAGGQLFDTNNKPTFVDKGIQVFNEFLLPLQRQGIFPKGITSMNEGTVGDAFVGGNLAMTESWSPLAKRALGEWDANRLGSAKPPKGPASRATFQDTAGVVVSAFSNRKRTAKRFAEFMSTTESSKTDMLVEGNPAAVPAVYDDQEIRDKYPSDILDDMKYNLMHANSEKYKAQPQVDEAISNQITPALLEQKTPEQALKQAEREITQLYESAGVL